MFRPIGFFQIILHPSPSATVPIRNTSPIHASEIRSFLSIIRNRVSSENKINKYYGELHCVLHRRFSSGRYNSPQQVSETSSVPFIREFRKVEIQHVSETLHCYSERTQLVDHYNISKNLNVKFIRFFGVTVHNKTELTGICWFSDNTTMVLHSVDFQNFQNQPRVSITTGTSRFCLAERPVVRRANLRRVNIGNGKEGGRKKLSEIFQQLR
jgi:hypothetical protein